MYRRALVVDDEPAICDLIQKVLASAGLETLTVTRSAEAPGLLEEGKFDVVFLDLHMASPDGIEIARQMRRTESYRATPIILISDDQRPSAMSIGFEAGANFFLYKPIDTDRLIKLVKATQGTAGSNRRRIRRVPVQSRVQLAFGLENLEGETVNVSPCGLLVKAQRILPAGSPVRVSLHIGGQLEPIVGSGSVVRIVGGIHWGFTSTVCLPPIAGDWKNSSCPCYPLPSFAGPPHRADAMMLPEPSTLAD